MPPAIFPLPEKVESPAGRRDVRKFLYFRSMKKCLLLCLAVLAVLPAAGYNDHRGHNLDSLERVVARWTPDAVDRASEQELVGLNNACRELMQGYNILNWEKSLFYARKALDISHPRGWNAADADAYRHIGQHFYAHEQYDSALVYYRLSLESVDRMAAGATSITSPEGYTETEIDDAYSSLYGAIGNLYNMMGDIPEAMDWYAKAGAIFEKHGWNESNSILHYNIGETWVDEGELRKAREAYGKALGYAEASGDSLMIVDVYKGLGRLYMEEGKTWRALPYLQKAEAYYAAHPDDTGFRTENLEYMGTVLARQKLLLGRLVGFLTGVALVAVGLWLARRMRRRKEQAEAGAAPGTAGEPLEAAEETGVAGGLSPREREILDLLAKGYTTRQMAECLGLSPETVKWYRRKLLVKFDAANVAELISTAKEQGLV